MPEEYFDLATGDIKAFIRDRLPNASRQNEELVLLFRFSNVLVINQLNRLQLAVRAIGSRVKCIGLLMMGINMDNVHMETIASIDQSCPCLKKFYASGLIIRDKQFNEQTLKPFFGRLEEITLQMSAFDCVNAFADCKKLNEWTQEIIYDFDGKCLNSDFPELRSVNFSKVDDIDNEHLEPFLSKNPQLKSVTLTRCTIGPKILELISKHVPAIEELAFNFRRSLVHRSEVQRNLKYLLKLEHLNALNLDCVGVAVGDSLIKMAEKGSPLNRVGLFCCPWENKLGKAFRDLKDLKSLHLSNITGLNDDGLEHLSHSLIGLTDLTLKFIDNITMDGVIKLIVECQRLSAVTLVLRKMTTISTDRYNWLVEAIKKRPEKIKLTITLWGSKNPLKLSNDLLERNLEFLEIRSKEDELNKNVEFDFYCDTADGGYDLIYITPQHGPRGCTII